MTEESLHELTEDSPSVQTHIGIIQGVIERMASNSTSSKAWCIALVTAVLVIVANKGKPTLALLSLIPIILFLSLDTYYLALEKGFKNSYQCFVKKVHDGTLIPEDLYYVVPDRNNKLRREAIKSFSVWGFYFGLMTLVFLAWLIILP